MNLGGRIVLGRVGAALLATLMFATGASAEATATNPQPPAPGKPAAAAPAVVLPAPPQAKPPTARAAPVDEGPKLELDFAKPNPDVVIGRLANGMRYAIYPRPSHGRESLQFRILAGSREETDTERGLAHYLEHMAFNGSRHFPAGALFKRFESLGLGAGRDQNAFTSYLDTIYLLDLPQADAEHLDFGFAWLGDVADGLNIDESEVDRERGVIQSERRLHLGPAWDAARATDQFKMPELRPTLRVPIGLEAQINGFKAEDLRRFWRKWYRPELAILVAVGDAPVADIKARIEASFGGWRRPGETPARPADGGLDPKRPSDVLTLEEPALEPWARICRLAPHEPIGPQSAATRRAALADVMWNEILNWRLQALRRADKPAFVTGAVARRNDYNLVYETCLEASPLNHDWAGAMATLAAEARRFELYGPTDAEVHDALVDTVGGLNHAVSLYPTAEASTIAASLMNAMTVGETYTTAEEERRIDFRALRTLDAAAVKAAFKRRWSDAGQPLIVVTEPEPVKRSDVSARWAAAMAAPDPAKPVDEKHAAWAYASFGPRGWVVERKEFHDPDFVQLKFSNGVVVNFKKTALSKGETLIRIRFGRGDLEIPADRSYAAKLGAETLLEGGFGKNSAEDLIRACAGHSCNAALRVERNHFLLNGSVTIAHDLDFELQLMTALLSDPGFHPSMDTYVPTVVRAAYRQWAISPAATAQLALNDVMVAPRPFVQPPLAQALAYRHDDFQALLKPILTGDALEVTIVGDVEEAQLAPVLAATVGALPARPWRDQSLPGGPRVKFPKPAPSPLTVYHDGPKDQASVLMVWPLKPWTPAQMRADRATWLMSQTLKDAIVEQIRQKLGKSYNPAAASQTARGGDEGTLSVQIDTSPDAADAVASTVRALSLGFARGDISSAALERARKPVVDGDLQQQSTNLWWIETLDGVYTHEDRLVQAKTWTRDLTGVTLGEVKAAARRTLSAEPIVIISKPCPTEQACHRELQETTAAAAAP